MTATPIAVPAPADVPVVLPAGGRLRVLVPELAASMAVGSVRLIAADGAAHRTLDMTARGLVDHWPMVDGAAVVEGVPAGTWQVEARAGGRTWTALVATSGIDSSVELEGGAARPADPRAAATPRGRPRSR